MLLGRKGGSVRGFQRPLSGELSQAPLQLDPLSIGQAEHLVVIQDLKDGSRVSAQVRLA